MKKFFFLILLTFFAINPLRAMDCSFKKHNNPFNAQSIPAIRGFNAVLVENVFPDYKAPIFRLRWDSYFIPRPYNSEQSYFEISVATTSQPNNFLFVKNVKSNMTRLLIPLDSIRNVIRRGDRAIFAITPTLVLGNTSIRGPTSTTLAIQF